MPESELPDAHFGNTEAMPFDWRTLPDDDTSDDDELLAQTPQDVIDMLGFDPLDLDNEE